MVTSSVANSSAFNNLAPADVGARSALESVGAAFLPSASRGIGDDFATKNHSPPRPHGSDASEGITSGCAPSRGASAFFADGASLHAFLRQNSAQPLVLENGDVWVSRELCDTEVEEIAEPGNLAAIGKWGEHVAFKVLKEHEDFDDVSWLNSAREEGEPYDITLRLIDSSHQVSHVPTLFWRKQAYLTTRPCDLGRKSSWK